MFQAAIPVWLSEFNWSNYYQTIYERIEMYSPFEYGIGIAFQIFQYIGGHQLFITLGLR